MSGGEAEEIKRKKNRWSRSREKKTRTVKKSKGNEKKQQHTWRCWEAGWGVDAADVVRGC